MKKNSTDILIKQVLDEVADLETCRDLPTKTLTKIVNGKEQKYFHIGCYFPHPTNAEGRQIYMKHFTNLLLHEGKNQYQREEVNRLRINMFNRAFGDCKRSKYNWALTEEEERI